MDEAKNDKFGNDPLAKLIFIVYFCFVHISRVVKGTKEFVFFLFFYTETTFLFPFQRKRMQNNKT